MKPPQRASTNTIPLPIVIWFVDDDADDSTVYGQFEDCILHFAKDCLLRSTAQLADPADVRVDHELPPQLTLGAPSPLAAALCWARTFTLTKPIRLRNDFMHHVQFVTYGLSAWEPLFAYLGNNGGVGLKGRPFWPHLVITDLFNGARRTVAEFEEVTGLDGYRLASQCKRKQIPCITITSAESAIQRCEPLWQKERLERYARSQLGWNGDVFKALQLIFHDLLERRWVTEFALVVEGRQNPNNNTFCVSFSKQGKVVSLAREVGPVPYAYLYLLAYGSVLARSNNWEVKSLDGWMDSGCKCLAVSRPPLDCEHRSIQIDPTLMASFQADYWKASKNEIFFGGNSKNRSSNMLNANILHLDPPVASCLPTFWYRDIMIARLRDQMREILPPEGMQWLETCRPP